MFFGKIKGTEDDWSFSITENIFDTYKEFSDEYHIQVINESNVENKLIKGDKDGNPILVDYQLSQEEINQQKIHKLKEYLYSTDWYAIRFADEGTPIPEEIKAKRAEARKEISKLTSNNQK